MKKNIIYKIKSKWKILMEVEKAMVVISLICLVAILIYTIKLHLF